MENFLQYDDIIKKVKAKENCKDCLGRGFIGYDRTTEYEIPCRCLAKALDDVCKMMWLSDEIRNMLWVKMQQRKNKTEVVIR